MVTESLLDGAWTVDLRWVVPTADHRKQKVHKPIYEDFHAG